MDTDMDVEAEEQKLEFMAATETAARHLVLLALEIPYENGLPSRANLTAHPEVIARARELIGLEPSSYDRAKAVAHSWYEQADRNAAYWRHRAQEAEAKSERQDRCQCIACVPVSEWSGGVLVIGDDGQRP
jgi:hypothetical protein